MIAKRKRRGIDPKARFRELRAAPLLPLVRIVPLALFGIVGCVWALVHTYTTTLPPMLVPVPPPAPTYDADAGEIPVPDWVYEDGGAL